MDVRKTIVAHLAAMKPPISGGCLCGRVSYVCSETPVWSVNCHCRSCQALSGAPFVSAFSVPAHTLSLAGETVSFRRKAESGHEVVTTHCASCGSRICAQSMGATHLANIFASTLTDASAFRPVSNVYLSEAVHWIVPPEAVLNFPKMPHA
jgi:hypothetical protein